MAAWQGQWWEQVQVLVLVLTHLCTCLAPPGDSGDLLVRKSPLTVDGSFHCLKQEVALFSVKLEAALAGIAPPPSLEGKRRLKEQSQSLHQANLLFQNSDWLDG